MEKLDIDGASDSAPTADLVQVERSPRRSSRNSNSAPEKGAIGQAESTQRELEIELSILQSNYEKCLNFGLKARVVERWTQDGEAPVLTIQMLNVSKCPGCGSWTPGLKCSMCQRKKTAATQPDAA